MNAQKEIKLSSNRLKRLITDVKKSATAVDLLYTTDSSEGILRIKEKDNFAYRYKGRKVKSQETLERIKKLVLPPAWERVWICPEPNGHLQATGYDARGRKQYKYHPLWTSIRNQTKFHNMLDLGRALPAIRQRIQRDLARHGLPQNKVLAAVVSLMECTCIRIGNGMYERLYGSFGLSTLKDRHVTITGSNISFSFRGKKGIEHSISLKSRKLASIVKQCRDIPGKELFQYYDADGKRHHIDSGMVNNYIKEISGGNFTAKDLRTWAGSLYAIEALKTMVEAESKTSIKKNIVTAFDMVAEKLGNTRSVCKKYYVHPAIPELYEKGELQKYLVPESNIDCGSKIGLSAEEESLMKILQRKVPVLIAAA